MKKLLVIIMTLILMTSVVFGESSDYDEFPTLEQELSIDYHRLTSDQREALETIYSELEEFEWSLSIWDDEAEDEAYYAIWNKFYDKMRSFGLEAPIESYEEYLEVLAPRFKEDDLNEIYTILIHYESALEAYDAAQVKGVQALVDQKLEELDRFYNRLYDLFDENGFDFDEFEGHVISGNMNYGLFDIVDGNITISPKSITKIEMMSDKQVRLYKKAWRTTKALVTEENLHWFVELEFNTDGYEDEMAYVIPIDDLNNRWRIGIDVRDAFLSDGSYHDEFYLTLVHELFHTMSLNASQLMLFSPKNADLYVDEEYGSFKKDSYINSFYKQFWKDEMKDYERFESAEAYYERHPKNFVTEYAASDVTEDISESFSYFVLKDKPKGETIADQKILFFYSYPELVSYREKVRIIIEKQ